MSSSVALLPSMADVVVIDNDRDRASGMIQAFDEADCENAVHLWKDGRGKTQCLGHKNIPQHCTLLLWHIGDLAGNWGDITTDLLVYYSGNGGEDSRFLENNQERIWRPIKIGVPNEDSGVLTVYEAKALLDYAYETKASIRSVNKPTLLEKSGCYLPALLMLCQGYLATWARYDVSRQIWMPSDITGAIQEMKWHDFLVSGKLENWFESTDVAQKKVLVSQTRWWVRGLGFLNDLKNPSDENIHLAYAAYCAAIMSEWQRAKSIDTESDAVLSLLEAIKPKAEAVTDDVSLANTPIRPSTVADAYSAIASQFSNLLFTQHNRYSLPEEDFTHILTIQDCPISMAASTVLSLFLETKVSLLDVNSLLPSLQPRDRVLLVISEKHLHRLARLRLQGFSGAVIAFSSEPTESAHDERKKHPIMLWGQGSHCICPFPCTLSFLVSQALMLFPMEPENLMLLQNQLEAPISWLEERVIPLLNDLESDVSDCSKCVEELDRIIQELRTITPVVYHSVATIDEETMQIQEHFQQKLADVRMAKQKNLAVILSLRKVFEAWRDLTVEGGESQGKLSEKKDG